MAKRKIKIEFRETVVESRSRIVEYEFDDTVDDIDNVNSIIQEERNAERICDSVENLEDGGWNSYDCETQDSQYDIIEDTILEEVNTKEDHLPGWF